METQIHLELDRYIMIREEIDNQHYILAMKTKIHLELDIEIWEKIIQLFDTYIVNILDIERHPLTTATP